MSKLLIIGGLLAFLLWLVYYIESNGQNKEVMEQQKIEIIKQNEIIETKKFQQELISKTVSSDSTINRRKWLRLVYSKRKNNHDK